MNSVAIVNFKGGTGKTTTAVNLAAALVKYHHKKVLLVDTDPQMNATMSLVTAKQWENQKKNNKTLFNLLNDKLIGQDQFQIEDYILKDVLKLNQPFFLDVIASDIELINCETTIGSELESYFSTTIKKIADAYDFIILDCPPSAGFLTRSALLAAKYFIIPTRLDFLSITSLQLTINFYKNISHGELIGILIVMRKWVNIESKLEEALKMQFGEIIFNTSIPDTIAFSESAFNHIPIYYYKEKSPASEAYRNFTNEFLQRIFKKG